MSYLHCSWVPASRIESQRFGSSRIARFHKKFPEIDPDEPFSPYFVQIDRILDKKERDDDIWYLVKWQHLGYDESTWEKADDINVILSLFLSSSRIH